MKTVRRNTFLDRLCAAWSTFWRTLMGHTSETINVGVEVKRCDECEHKRGLNAKTMVVDLALDGDTDDVRHLRELLKAKDERRLVELPVNVGAHVWVNGILGVGRCEEHKITSVSVYIGEKTDIWVNAEMVEYGGEARCSFGTDQIGKTVFLTREEAEAALKGGFDG